MWWSCSSCAETGRDVSSLSITRRRVWERIRASSITSHAHRDSSLNPFKEMNDQKNSILSQRELERKQWDSCFEKKVKFLDEKSSSLCVLSSTSCVDSTDQTICYPEKNQGNRETVRIWIDLWTFKRQSQELQRDYRFWMTGLNKFRKRALFFTQRNYNIIAGYQQIEKFVYWMRNTIKSMQVLLRRSQETLSLFHHEEKSFPHAFFMSNQSCLLCYSFTCNLSFCG